MDEFECGICFEIIENQDEPTSVLGCGHSFCAGCIGRCKKCPYCRKDVGLKLPCDIFFIDEKGLKVDVEQMIQRFK